MERGFLPKNLQVGEIQAVMHDLVVASPKAETSTGRIITTHRKAQYGIRSDGTEILKVSERTLQPIQSFLGEAAMSFRTTALAIENKKHPEESKVLIAQTWSLASERLLVVEGLGTAVRTHRTPPSAEDIAEFNGALRFLFDIEETEAA